MKLTLFEPVDGPVAITTAGSSKATVSVGLVSEAEPGPDAIVGRIKVEPPDPRIPPGAVPATDSHGRVVGYVEGVEQEP